MIGKSYDGTLANAAAATGVDGLTTIVPISAISSWYDYTRSNGVIQRGGSYPSSLANTVTNPDRRAYCAAIGPRWPRPTATSTATTALLGGARLPAGRRQRDGERLRGARHQRRERAARSLSASGGRAQAHAPEAVDHADGPHRPVRLPPRRLGRHDPPLVRPGAVGDQERHPQRARGDDRALRRASSPTTRPGPMQASRRSSSASRTPAPRPPAS